jgi:hypothetical protein
MLVRHVVSGRVLSVHSGRSRQTDSDHHGRDEINTSVDAAERQ